MKVLFSPIGNTDPISVKNDKEGSLLQICRKYKPEKIYLYMSKEIYELHKHDNRYIMFLEELYNDLGIKLDYEIIKREELIDAHIFDYFYKDFRNILSVIHKDHDKDEIILNISSGTPAMKNALFVLTAISNFKMLPIQVSTPAKGGNYTVVDYDPEIYLHITKEINKNPKKYADRTCIAVKENFNYELKKEIIANHLKEYNYSAALTVADTIKEFLPDKTYNLINAAICRINLNSFTMRRFLEKASDNFFLYKGNYYEEIEYMLYLNITRKRNLILEFIRGITPLLYKLFILTIKKECNIEINDYFLETKTGLKWDDKKLKNDNKGILDILNAQFKGRFNMDSNVYSSNLINIIKYKCQNDRIIELSKIVRNIESKARNEAAHEIISITDDVLKKRIGYDSNQIMDLIKELAERLDIGLTNEIWNSYDMMNTKIIDSMNY